MKPTTVAFLAVLAVLPAACERQAEPPRSAAAGAPAAPTTAPASVAARATAPPAEAAEGAPAAPPEPVVVPAGTALPLVFETTAASDKSAVGERVLARLAEDVRVRDEVVLPAGAEVRGRVTVAVKAGHVSGRSRLAVAFDEVMVKNVALPLSASGIDVTGKSQKSRDTKIAVGAAGAGALIGAIAGGGSGALKGGLIGGAAGGTAVLITKGEEVVFPAGSRHTVKLRQALRVD